MKALDWIFKIGILIIGVGFLAVYFLSSQSGRYVSLEHGDQNTILDTKTGIILSHSISVTDYIAYLDYPNSIIKINKVKREVAEK